MEPRPVGPARFDRRGTVELLMFQGGCQIRFQTQPRPSTIAHHLNVVATCPELGEDMVLGFLNTVGSLAEFVRGRV